MKFISLLDLGMAYRKAKADLFYSPRACKEELSVFESSLANNLHFIHRKLSDGVVPVVSDESWTVVPKIIDDKVFGVDCENIISSDPGYLWECIRSYAEKKSKRIKVMFRLMEKLPISFHVLSALWINKIGHKFDNKLSAAACGNRLRREKDGFLNLLSMGSTVPYMPAYRKWRDDAFEIIEKALINDEQVVAITADVSSFYHEIDVRFMLNNDFIDRIGVEMSADEKALHELFINSLHEWAIKTPLQRGLPVGLVASSVIANVALFEFDLLIRQEVVPLYYGRYVDDIILVMKNGKNFKKSIEVWDWLIDRMGGCLDWCDDNKTLLYRKDYLMDSKICFANEKNKTFFLANTSGMAVLKSIRREVQSRTSEWRSLPNLPDNPDSLESVFLAAIQKDGVGADSLRKADKISVRRAEFALKLRDIEAFVRALPAADWELQRHAFLTAYIRHVLVLPTFFDFFNYLPRIIAIATYCADFDYLRKILDALQCINQELITCNCAVRKEEEDVVNCSYVGKFQENIKTIVYEAIVSAFPLWLSKSDKNKWCENFEIAHPLCDKIDVTCFQKKHVDYLRKDIAYRPLKQYLMPVSLMGVGREMIKKIKKSDFSNLAYEEIKVFLQDKVVVGCDIIAELAGLRFSSKMPSGLLFPVRPLNIQDLYLFHNDPFSVEGRESISNALLAMRGFKPEKKLPVRGDKPFCPIEIAYNRDLKKLLRVSVTSWKTESPSWIASASQSNDPDKSRLDRINHLLNQIIRGKNKPDYLIFPELSIPPHWFLSIARKLQDKGINLICGIEYVHARHKSLHNQVWAALSHDSLGFPATMIYRQDKLHPALHEERELQRISGKVMRPQLKRWCQPPIIKHGDFHFAILVCSELTNISYRAALRGNIDALFVPEWNKDTEGFNSLVESAALDMHAYIIQCNNREYSDSRIRAPYKDSWKRDIVRVKGGIDDYFITGEIDIYGLRAFQSSHRSPDQPFKPVPDGFVMSHYRKTMPGKNEE